MMYRDLIKLIRDLYPGKEVIHLHEPILGKLEKDYLNQCIDSTFVSSVGPFIQELEENIAKFTGARYAIATVNGTAAIHLTLKSLGVASGDAVITQSLNFIAGPNAITYCGAEPIFIDIDEDDLGLSPIHLERFLKEECQIKNKTCQHIKSGKNIKACLPVHIFGNPAKVDQLSALCNEWMIPIVEDSAESLGSYIDKQHTGTFGLAGTFSFNGNKIITAGGGGCVITNDESLAKQLKHLSTTAKINDPTYLAFDDFGFNYRMPNLNAALLMAQFEQLNSFLENKAKIAQSYQTYFQSREEVFFTPRNHCTTNHWLNTILMPSAKESGDLIRACHAEKIMIRPCWTPVHSLPMYQTCLNDTCLNTQVLAPRLINLPSGVNLNA